MGTHYNNYNIGVATMFNILSFCRFVQLILHCKSCGDAIQEETGDGVLTIVLTYRLGYPNL